MNLLEILNTKIAVSWQAISAHENRGVFDFDDQKITIHLDEYDFNGKTLVDFGFDNNGSISAINSKTSAARLIGAVLNGSTQKIKKINPDFILVAVSKDSGLVDSRKSLYNTIISWMLKRTSFTYQSQWEENEYRFFKVIAKRIPSDVEIQTFGEAVKQK